MRDAMLFITNLHFSKDGNGGQQRTYFLIKELSKHYDLKVLSPYTNANDFNLDADFILNKAVYYEKLLNSNKVFRLVLGMLNRLLNREASKRPIHQSNFASFVLKNQLNTLKAKSTNRHINTVVFDTLAMVVDIKPGLFEQRILNAHNFDSELVQMNLDHQLRSPEVNPANIELLRRQLAIYKRYEYDIDQYFTEIWVCSHADTLKFKAANPDTKVIFYELPNGSDTDGRQFQSMGSQYKKFLFVGSLNYFPNVNGLKWFVETIFRHLPNSYELTIVGKSPRLDHYKYLDLYPNVDLVGEVESVEGYYQDHDVFVVPLLEGSGTRLKILEAMSYGKLVLSTPKGIEGIAAVDGAHYLGFDDFESFKTKVLSLMDDLDVLASIRKNGRQLMEDSYSWKKIVENYVKQRHGA